MEETFENDDLRRYIFSFLRKEPQKKCKYCHCVCVWDKKVNDYFNVFDFTICRVCWYKNYNGPGCIIS